MTDRGFTLLELVVATAVTMAVMASLLTILQAAPDALAVQSETADMHQRVRVASATLVSQLMAAADVRPYRSLGPDADPPGTFKVDTVTAIGAEQTTFWLKVDERAGVYQLMSYAGGANPDVPVVDNLVSLALEYFGDPVPPRLVKPLADPVGPWTTYGPKPSLVPVPPYAAGENCVFVNDADDMPVPRLPSLAGAGVNLVALPEAQLTDGPWCPDAGAPDRWDADLLRIRVIAIALRVQAAAAALRGPAGTLFAHAGTAGSGRMLAPDVEIRLRVAPRNLNRGR